MGNIFNEVWYAKLKHCAVIRSAVYKLYASSIVWFYSIVETINTFNMQVCIFGLFFPCIDWAIEKKVVLMHMFL